MISKETFLASVRGGLIVSCQALEDEPLHGSHIMARMALAAQMGGAVGIRCNSVPDAQAIRAAVSLPIIGLIKRHYEGFEPYITPTMAEVDALIAAGADVVAVDATDRPHPGGPSGAEFIRAIKTARDVLILADISTLEEGMLAERAGADFLSTTLSGYTPYTLDRDAPDFPLMRALAGKACVPVLAEGRIETPAQARECLRCGAYAVIVGGAITRPQLITRSFVTGMRAEEAKA